MTRCRPLPLLAAALLLAACSSLSPRVAPAPTAADREQHAAAQAYLELFTNRNRDMGGFKGIGNISLSTGETIQSFRTAWMGEPSGRLRIEILNIAGQPMVSFADDGQWVTLLTRHPLRFEKKRSSGGLLRHFLGVPLETRDWVALIIGQAPLRDHHEVRLTPPAAAGEAAIPENGGILELRQRWGRTVERIHFLRQGAEADIRCVELFDYWGALVLRVLFENITDVDGFRLPDRLMLTNGRGSRVHIEIQRRWTGIDPDPSLFTLAPPGPSVSPTH